jgi:hypothetical protein
LHAAGTIGVVATAVVLSLPLLFDDCGYDREMFRYMGMLVAGGGMPYVDAFDHKPPLIYAILALVHPWDPIGGWLVETVLLAASAVAMYALALRRQWPLALCYPLAFLALLRNPSFVWTGGLTRSYLSPLIVIAIAVAFAERPEPLRGPRPTRWTSLAVGVLFSACFFLQQNDALPIAVLAVFCLVKAAHPAREALRCALGAGAVAAAVILWIASGHAFGAFVDDAFLFNTRVYSAPGFVSALPGRLMSTVSAFGFRPWFVATGVLLALLPWRALWTRSLATSPIVYCFFGLVAQLVMMNVSGRQYEVYYLPLFAWAVVLMGETFRLYAEHRVLPRRFLWASVLGALLLLTGLSALRQMKSGAAMILRDEPVEICNSSVARYAQEVAGQRGQFYAFGTADLLSLNRHHNIVAPTRWVFMHLWDEVPRARWDPERAEFRTILAGLDRYATKYVYTTFDREHPPFTREGLDLNAVWLDYLERHYTRLEPTIWRRNGR